jgi:hypothetical protein
VLIKDFTNAAIHIIQIDLTTNGTAAKGLEPISDDVARAPAEITSNVINQPKNARDRGESAGLTGNWYISEYIDEKGEQIWNNEYHRYR